MTGSRLGQNSERQDLRVATESCKVYPWMYRASQYCNYMSLWCKDKPRDRDLRRYKEISSRNDTFC